MPGNVQAVYLTEEDKALLQQIINEVRGKSQNRVLEIPNPPRTNKRHMYVALPQDEISALEELGTGGGTGAIEQGDADTPGSGLCDLYRLTQDGLHSMGTSVRVNSLSRTALQREWIQVHQDDFGNWWAITGGGTGVIKVRFRITDPYFCGACTAYAEVISVPPGMSTVPDHDPYYGIVLCDRLGSFLNEPAEALIGRTGYATYLESLEEGPCPGMPNPGWEITSMAPFGEGC